MHPGILYAALAYTAWGILPLYFRQIASVGALEVVMHRTLWSLVFLAVVLAARRQWAWAGALRHAPRVVAVFGLSALLLSANWLTYVWAVNHHHVVDASLGYFILPLVSVALGCVFLRERPRPGQWAAVAVAAAGVVWLTVQTGRLPWIALVLALTFGFYGLLRKTAVLGALEGLALETALLAPLALGGLAWLAWAGEAAWPQAGAADHRRAAAAVRGRGAAHSAGHAGAAAVHLALAAVRAGRVAVRRGGAERAASGLRADLGCAGALHARRGVAAAHRSCIVK